MLLQNETEEKADPDEKTITIWNSLLRRGTAALRSDRPNLFYPIYVDNVTHENIVNTIDLSEAMANIYSEYSSLR